ncbi:MULTISPECIES: aminodeoxychorismate synthase component I [Oceanimonas]|uniref:aminodeoxychorismate synthase n=1 Tax=Oceanimonas doudoroffii TaxID=84158 RepID=A0A233RGY0_9GAMM|nr:MULTISPECIES: aminodeoxychorismate synthase component I [Oceanimonas]NHI00773.1 Aminodeoxychorismate synthase component 1 [Oceanimonas sp. MB9]OXY82647.1 aminodeoxychorismate synthase, component I [Oceanimonas doudoroffii]
MGLPLHIHSEPFAGPVRDFFSPLANSPWAVLLESASPLAADSRFHILSASPVATLVTSGDATTITHADGTDSSRDCPFALLKTWQQRLLGDVVLPEEYAHLPFAGGALGLFGYDLGRRLERVPELAANELATPDMAVGLYDWTWVIDRECEQAHLLVLGDEDALTQKLAWWRRLTAAPGMPFHLTGPWQANQSREIYGDHFNRVQDYLAAGDCYQINLTVRFNAPFEGEPWQAYCGLSEHNRAPFSAFMQLPKSTVLSLSPERFIALEGRRVETKPIKGTRPRGDNEQQDQQLAEELAAAPKDRSENLMIVDLLRNDIGRVCVPGSVRVPSLFAIESFPAVHHLVSTITGELQPGLNGTDLLAATFPGGSITGAPKVRAMEIIEELEPHRRHGYCGSMGYLSAHGRMDTSITIRTLLAEQGRLYCWAGGGVVADSKQADEYQELFDKLGRILPVLERL